MSKQPDNDGAGLAFLIGLLITSIAIGTQWGPFVGFTVLGIGIMSMAGVTLMLNYLGGGS